MKIYFYRITGSIFLIVIGLIIWFSNLGIIDIHWHRDWPVILIAVGVLELFKHIVKK